MKTNKKGLSDIVTTALIILLVAVAVAAIWAFVSPALRGTGTQFTKTSVCVSNQVDPLTCRSTVDSSATPNAAGRYPVTVQIRRTLSDGVAVPQEIETTVGTGTVIEKQITTDKGTKDASQTGDPTVGEKIPRTQGDLITLKFDGLNSPSETTIPLGSSPQTKVITTYQLPDNTIVKCSSLPITCNVA